MLDQITENLANIQISNKYLKKAITNFNGDSTLTGSPRVRNSSERKASFVVPSERKSDSTTSSNSSLNEESKAFHLEQERIKSREKYHQFDKQIRNFVKLVTDNEVLLKKGGFVTKDVDSANFLNSLLASNKDGESCLDIAKYTNTAQDHYKKINDPNVTEAGLQVINEALDKEISGFFEKIQEIQNYVKHHQDKKLRCQAEQLLGKLNTKMNEFLVFFAKNKDLFRKIGYTESEYLKGVISQNWLEKWKPDKCINTLKQQIIRNHESPDQLRKIVQNMNKTIGSMESRMQEADIHVRLYMPLERRSPFNQSFQISNAQISEKKKEDLIAKTINCYHNPLTKEESVEKLLTLLYDYRKISQLDQDHPVRINHRSYTKALEYFKFTERSPYSPKPQAKNSSDYWGLKPPSLMRSEEYSQIRKNYEEARKDFIEAMIKEFTDETTQILFFGDKRNFP